MSDSTLTRREAASFLTSRGYSISHNTLAQDASNGSGPPYERVCGIAHYRQETLLEWAQSRPDGAWKRGRPSGRQNNLAAQYAHEANHDLTEIPPAHALLTPHYAVQYLDFIGLPLFKDAHTVSKLSCAVQGPPRFKIDGIPVTRHGKKVYRPIDVYEWQLAKIKHSAEVELRIKWGIKT